MEKGGEEVAGLVEGVGGGGRGELSFHSEIKQGRDIIMGFLNIIIEMAVFYLELGLGAYS